MVLLLSLLNMCFTTTDIDECKGPNKCKEKQKCVNDPGSYHCSCIGGYHLDGEACVRDQPPGQFTINIVVGKYIYCISPSVLSHFRFSQLNFIKKKKCTIFKISYFKIQ
jgi:hypothetical protein